MESQTIVLYMATSEANNPALARVLLEAGANQTTANPSIMPPRSSMSNA